MNKHKEIRSKKPDRKTTPSEEEKAMESNKIPTEIGGREGLEPTRYNDWERNGRCIDF